VASFPTTNIKFETSWENSCWHCAQVKTILSPAKFPNILDFNMIADTD